MSYWINLSRQSNSFTVRRKTLGRHQVNHLLILMAQGVAGEGRVAGVARAALLVGCDLAD
jgi:hypothetical protein